MNFEDDSYTHETEPKGSAITIKLVPRVDKNNATYHIARTDAPVLLDLSKCTFFVFTREKPELCIVRTREDKR